MMRSTILAVTGLAFGFTACSSHGTSVVEVHNSAVASVSISLPAASLVAGRTGKATATLRDASGGTLSGRAITWASSSNSVATIDDAGMITGVAPGAAVISATSEGVSGNATMDVVPPAPVPVASVAVSLGANSLNPGQTTQATAVTRDASNNVLTGRTVTWTSSNTNVATVNSSGLVTAVAVGSAQITGTSESQSGSANLSVVAVPAVPVATVSVSLASSTLNVGQTTQATATTRDANNNVLTGRTITWSSSNTSIATVSASGLVTAVAAGSANITATSESKTGSASLTVNTPAPVPVATVTVSLTASTLNPGLTTQATATTRDANNNVLTGRTIAWSSTNTAVATVSASGLVTAVANGTTQITATSEGKSGNATLTVQDPPPPPPPGTDNEPTGMTVISDRGFNAQGELGWTDDFSGKDGGSMTIIQDATAPHSSPNILRATFPTGFTSAGTGPGSAEKNLSSRPRTLYVSYWSRVSTNWYGHDSGVNKEFYAYAGGSPYVYFNLRCMYNGAITPDIALQDMAVGGTHDISPNLVPSARITRGQWYHIEVVLVANTANTSDGSLDWWLDGVHIGSYSGLRFSSSGATWNLVHWTTIWGGVGGPNVPATMTKDIDHMYLSGKP